MRFVETDDEDVIRSIVTHPKVYPHISDDGSPAPDDWKPNPAVKYILVFDGCELLGLWAFVPENFVTWNVHTCLLPIAYGRKALEAAKQMAEWVWKNIGCQRVTTNVPEYNRLALRFAERAGMVRFGVNPSSYMKDGKLYDQILLGMSNPAGAKPCH